MADRLTRDINSYIRKLRKIKNVEVGRASASALNKVGALVRTDVTRDLSKKTRKPAKHIRPRMRLSRATAKKQAAKFNAYVRPISAVRLLTANQVARSKGRGTNRKGVRSRGYNFPGAFIQPGIAGKVHVFRRKGAARLPLEKVTINISDRAEATVAVVVKRRMREDYRRLLESDLKFRLGKYNAR